MILSLPVMMLLGQIKKKEQILEAELLTPEALLF